MQARGMSIRMGVSSHVETVVLMSRIKDCPPKKCRIPGLIWHLGIRAGETV